MKTAQEIFSYVLRHDLKNHPYNIEDLFNELRQNAIQEIKECKQKMKYDRECNSNEVLRHKCFACQDKIRFWDLKEDEIRQNTRADARVGHHR